jgi:crotonobetainyl-CoA:carnitine CoA-transferase CaiB-like acyl-CoA transferase
MKRRLSDPPTEETPVEISPEADAAMAELVKIFSDPNLPTKPRFRRRVEGPDEFDVMFESIMEEQFGDNEYKEWVKRLYNLGLIARLPAEWK